MTRIKQATSARDITSAVKSLNIDATPYDLKTIAGRHKIIATIQKIRNGNNPNIGTKITTTPARDTQITGSRSSPKSNGYRSLPVRGPVPVGGTATGSPAIESVTEHAGIDGGGETVRRITGSADVPLTQAGKKQASTLSDRMTEPFDAIFHSPSQRSKETVAEFAPLSIADPLVLKSLDGWARGIYEGRPAKSVQSAMSRLIMKPDKVPPGKSPISGLPGQSWNGMAIPMFRDIMRIKNELPASERALIVTSGGNLQALDAWGKSGYPKSFTFSHKDIARQPYWSVTGKMFKLSPKGLMSALDNKDPGIYLIEHGETAFNSKAGNAVTIPERDKTSVR